MTTREQGRLLPLSSNEERFVREVPDLEGRGPVEHLIHIGRALLCLRGEPDVQVMPADLDALVLVRFKPLERLEQEP